MKTRILLFLAIAFSIVSCQGDNESVGSDTQLELPNGDYLTVPACWELTSLPADSKTGQINCEEKDISIVYDIGYLASYYVDVESPNKIIENSANEEFWYEVVNKQYLSDEDCCVFFTFPERGPANFIIPNDENFDKVLEVMKTYQSN